MTVQELVDSFALEGISGGNAVFNTEKLDWMNGQYIRATPADELLHDFMFRHVVSHEARLLANGFTLLGTTEVENEWAISAYKAAGFDITSFASVFHFKN